MGRHKTATARSLALRIAKRIVDLVPRRNLQAGDHLPKHQLAVEFHVSRSPVRGALEILKRKKVVELRPNCGYFLIADRAGLARAAAALGRQLGDAPYLRVAADRLAGRLPEQFKEVDLIRHYGIRRSELTGMLGRMAREGWIERKPGYGWKFLPVLTSAESHVLSYRFRAAIEPAALLEPTFRVDREAFVRLRAEQESLIAGRIRELSSAELFQIGSHFHETVIGCCGNPFFLEALQRVDRLRRLIEYRAMVNTELFVQQAREHVKLLDLLEGGDRVGASEFLRRHLEAVREVKSGVLSSRKRPATRAPAPARRTLSEPAPAHVHF